MKILVLTIAVFTLNVYITNATSLDPTRFVEMEDAKSESDDVRTKRSGDIFSSLLKKKFGLISSLTGSSSGKSIGHSEHYEEPLSYNTKSFNLWGVKKAIMGSVLQAAKAITGGVIALKGQLIKAKGHVVVAKGKLMQTKGEAISNFGKTIATHAFDSHQEPQIEVYNHLPVTPIHQPTSYGVSTALGYQAPTYPGNGFQSNAYPSHGFPLNSYPATAHSFPTGFAVPSVGYGGAGAGTGYGGVVTGNGNGYGVYGGGGGYTAKRAVQHDSSRVANQNTKSLVDKDSVQAGLLIFKPIKMGQDLQIGGGGLTSQGADSVLHNFNQQHFKLQNNGNGFNGVGPTAYNGIGPSAYNGVGPTAYNGVGPAGFKSPAAGFQSAFPGFQGTVGGYANHQQLQQQQQQSVAAQHQAGGGGVGYSLFQDPAGRPAAQPAYQFPTGGGSGGVSDGSFETFPAAAAAAAAAATAGQGAYGLQDFSGFPQPANSQEFNRQLAAFSGHASQEASDDYNGGDQHDSASDSAEQHVAQPSSYKDTRHVHAPRSHHSTQAAAAAATVSKAAGHFLPTTARNASMV